MMQLQNNGMKNMCILIDTLTCDVVHIVYLVEKRNENYQNKEEDI